MKNICAVICFIFYFALYQPVYSFSKETVNDEETIPFTVDMLPVSTNLTSFNSSSIVGFWKPSPSIEGINISQLEGSFSAGVSAYSRKQVTSLCRIQHMDKLNETGELTFDKLLPDTVYQICFQSQWYPPQTTIVCFQPNDMYYRNCQLIRTYTENDTTINPVPVFGEYTWTQIMTSNSTLGIVVNASASSDLPFVKLNITVTLDSEGQSQVFNMPMEWANFTFDGLDLEPKDYLLSINFTSIDNESDGLLAATNTFNETIRTKAPTPTPTSTSTQAPSKGDKPFACHFLFLVFLAMFVLM